MGFLRQKAAFLSSLFEDEMLDELYRQMSKVVRHKLQNKNDAGDVVQDAWVKILEHQSSLRDYEKLIPWAKTIATNLAYNANRSRRVEAVYDGYVSYLTGTSTSSGPLLLTELSDLLGRLDPATRTLLLYKFYYGFKDEEIADALSVPVGTVKARIHRSKARIKAESQD
jgi:RNA polymerase sigma-70 factor (ECF subfamily)